ncbi:MAG: hypothetical protein RLZZ129_1547 [Verrucomicrobiota bacterium]|jgi:hypothetical protein
MIARRFHSAARVATLLLAWGAILQADTLESHALQTLTRVLESEPSSEQIHAAEALIKFGCAPQVHTWLSRDGTKHGDTPVYRVIFWRALAGSTPSPAERQMLVDKILAIAATPGLPDRLHAIESAAKLRAPVPADMVPELQTLAAALPERDGVFVHWLLWRSHPPDNPAGAFVRWLDSPDSVTRLRAAHMLRWLPPSDPAVHDALTRAARISTTRDLATAIIIGAAALLQTAPADHTLWRERLEPIAHGSDPTPAYHALQGLAALYCREDLPLIAALLDHPHPSVRVGAAWAILAVERRDD